MANQVVNIDVQIGTKDLTKLDSLLIETGVALKGVETNLNDVGNSVTDVVAGLGEVGAGAKDISKIEDAAVNASKGAGKLADETKKVGKASKEAGKEATIFGDIKDKFADMTSGVKKVIVSMRTLKGAIAATGIGALLIAFGALVAYFKTSEEGSKKLAIATETISLLFGKLVEFLASLGEGLVNAFSNPMESIKALGMAIVNNVVERIVSLLDAVKFLGSALVKVFKGDFSGAMDDVASAGSEMVDVMTGVDDSVTKIGETSKKVFSEVKKAVEESVEVAIKLVDATRALRDLQQELTVTNAELTKELEGQKRIAEDTTLDYQTRKTALEEVNAIQIQLAENIKTQAKAEEDLLKIQISQEANYDKREELETQLADKTAERINAELTLQTVKQEADKVGRELETEEIARKTEINDILTELDLERIEDVYEKAQEELRIEEEKLIEQMRLKKASDEEISKVEGAFIAKRKKLKKEEVAFNKKLDKEEQTGKLQVISSAFKAIASIVGEQSMVGKIAAVSGATIDTFVAANNALANTPLPPPFPQIAAGIAYAAGIANVRSILATPVPGGAGGGGAPSLGGAPVANPITVGDIDSPLQAPDVTTTAPTMRAYVISGDVSTSQEADARLNRRRSLG